MRPAHQHADRAEEFDDDFDDVEDLLPSQAREIVDEMSETMLPSDAIIIEQELGTALSRDRAAARINHHFAESDLGYKQIADDTFKLRVRGSSYPWFGTFAGRVHIVEDVGNLERAQQGLHTYVMSGILRFRLSVMYTTIIALFFLILLYWLHPGFTQSVVFFFFGVGGCVGGGYALGQGQRDEAQERVEESFLRLRGTFSNRN